MAKNYIILPYNFSTKSLKIFFSSIWQRKLLMKLFVYYDVYCRLNTPVTCEFPVLYFFDFISMIFIRITNHF